MLPLLLTHLTKQAKPFLSSSPPHHWRPLTKTNESHRLISFTTPPPLLTVHSAVADAGRQRRRRSMECFGCGNSTAMSVPFQDWRVGGKGGRRRRAVQPWGRRQQRWAPAVRVRREAAVSGGGATETCMEAAVREEEVGREFADEEDFVKAGGSELLFVEMQEKKTMELQCKIADKLPPIILGDSLLDLVVIGCGPAGLSLAAESAKQGLNVGLIGPDLPFTNNYGVWEDEFRGLGLQGCIEHAWKDTIVYLGNSKPVLIGRAYGRVSRHLLHEELLQRCYDAGVAYLDSKVEKIIEADNGHSVVVCKGGSMIHCRLATVASGAASGKLLEYEVGGPRVSVQTAYGVEVEVENNPYDPSLMVFMDYRDYAKNKTHELEDNYPTFLYVMPISSTRVFYEETCLASRQAMPFDLLRKKLMLRLEAMGIRINKIIEEEWSYIPVGGSLPKTEQRNLAFGAAASMVHPATGYSVVRSLSEAPTYASAIASILKKSKYSEQTASLGRSQILSMQAWNTLWPQERKRQRAFFLFGLALIIQLDIEGTRTFFDTFFRLPKWMWWGFLGSTLSSVDLILFAICMFVIAPNSMRKCLVRHLLSDPTGTTMIRTYFNL